MENNNILEKMAGFSTFEYIKEADTITLCSNFFNIINSETYNNTMVYDEFKNVIDNHTFFIDNKEIQFADASNFEDFFTYLNIEGFDVISHDDTNYVKWQSSNITNNAKIIGYYGVVSDVTNEQQALINEKNMMHRLIQTEELANANSWELDLIRQKYWMTMKSKSVSQLDYREGLEIPVSDMIKNLPNVLIEKDGEYHKATGIVDFYGLDKVDLNKPDEIYKVMQVGLKDDVITKHFVHTYKPLIKNGKLIKILGSTRDVTEEKERENNLINANIRLETTEWITKSGSWEYDIAGGMYWVSANLLRQVDPNSSDDIIIPVSTMNERIPRSTIIRNGKKYHASDLSDFYNLDEIDYTQPDKIYSLLQVGIKGDEHNCVHTTYKAIFENDKIVKLIGSSRNVTEEKANERELIHAKELAEEATAQQSRFVANMSHEIRTPLNAILGYAEIMKDQNDDKKLDHYLRSIDVAGNSLLSLVNNILDYSKVKANKFTATYIPTLIEDFCEELKILFYNKISQKNLDFEIIYDTDLPTFMLPTATIRQVLINLLGNASKFTQEGIIILKAKTIVNKDETYDIDFSVSDTGIGIPKESLKLIFREFEQADLSHEKSGTGLGLALSLNFAKLVGGAISVESKVGKGSIFTLHMKNIKLASDDIQAMHKVKENQKFKFYGQKVLVLDDIADNREVLKAHCESMNLEAKTYETGGQALASIERYKPDIILTDLRMPTMSGEEFAKNARALDAFKDTPIICITASINPEENYHLDNFNEVLNKPIGSHKLAMAISKYIDFDLINNEKVEFDEFNLHVAFRSLLLEDDVFFKLKNLYYEEVKQLKVALNPKKVKEFANSLIDLSVEIDNDVLNEVGEHLLDYCNSLDISSMIENINLMFNYLDGENIK